MESSSSCLTQSKGNTNSSTNPFLVYATSPRNDISKVLCYQCRAPTYYRFICSMWILHCASCDLPQPKCFSVEVNETKEHPSPELTFDQMNPELLEDPDVLKSVYENEFEGKEVEPDDYYHDPYPGEHSSDSEWTNDDCHWK
ncbi:hypothetical protein E3N88_38138 [Mikania micrantha]|uniref:Uncharacterized protein n=1 Tax=Mikania micrantha TaxID=192012 RepID=A0A5N6LT48_9ASTR|nr:hypothetical protein E3N88_38138 [Mikania micrantha]